MKKTVIFKDIDFDVLYEKEEEERQVLYNQDGTGYPGCSSYIRILSIKHKGTDFADFLDETCGDWEEEIKELIN